MVPVPGDGLDLGGLRDVIRHHYHRDRRAWAVFNYMVAAGLPDANLTAEGFGESRPIADHGTAEGTAKNRRIEFTLEG